MQQEARLINQGDVAMEHHEIAKIFPMLPDEELLKPGGLADDILEHGLLDPVVTFEGKILDGRHRDRACELVNAVARTEEFVGDFSAAVAYVTSRNLQRVFWDKEDRIIAASKLAQLKKGRPAAENGTMVPFPTEARLAEQFDVDVRSIKRGRRVREHGAPELVEAFEKKEISARAGADLTKLEPHEQAAVVAAGPDVAKRVAAEIRTSAPPMKRVVSSAMELANRRGIQMGILVNDMKTAVLAVETMVTALTKMDETQLKPEFREFVRQAAERIQVGSGRIVALLSGVSDEALHDWIAEDEG